MDDTIVEIIKSIPNTNQ